MDFFLIVIGSLALAVSVTGIVFGVFMATSAKTRSLGAYFALWWVPGAAAASGVIMRDLVTFTIGFVCFCVAGAVFGIEARGSGAKKAQVRTENGKKRAGRRRSERTTAENEKKNYRRRAS